jgi:NAD(P)H-dependent FMN reductase
MDELLTKHPLDEICALQWQRCVERSAEAFDQMNPNRWIEVGYESFVTDPEEQVRQIMAFAGIEATDDQVAAAVAGVRADSVGKGRASLSDGAAERLRNLIDSTLQKYGY